MNNRQEIYISVDIEASGPIPGVYSMLSIGACNVYDDSQSFSCELKPISKKAIPEALKVSGFSLEELELRGLKPKTAMSDFQNWLKKLIINDERLIFVGFNAPFDWSFINYYFHRYLGENPFGISALDIKAMYFGKTNVSWKETSSRHISKLYRPNLKGDHDALHDAKYQAELFRLVRGLNLEP